MKQIYLLGLLLLSFSAFATGDIQHKVYPNPATEEVYVSFDAFVPTGDYQIQLMDLLGNIVSEQYVTNFGSNDPMVFSLDALPKGYFFVRIIGAEETSTVRILKE